MSDDRTSNSKPNNFFEEIIYERKWFDKGGKHSLENRVSDLLEFLPEERDLNAIDIGCAEGQMIEHFSDRFRVFDGIEKSELLFNIAKKKFAHTNQTTITHASIREYQLTKNYDYIFLLGVLHYFENEFEREKVVEKLIKKTKIKLFIRTSFLENRVARPSEKKPDMARLKSCSLNTISKLCDLYNCRWYFLDNRYRGLGDNRLGDLVVIERVGT